MIRTLAKRLLDLIPARYRRDAGMYLLRQNSPEMRAYTDLFVPPYEHWAEWYSGLNDSIHVLFGLVRAVRPRVVVEVGSARGRSACAMALACRLNQHGAVYAIDPHTPNAWTEAHGQTLEFFKARVAEYDLGDWCHIIQSDSLTAAASWRLPIDFLFLDGDHTYEGVRDDFEAFRPFLARNALVAFHDTTWEHHRDFGTRSDIGVPRFLEELKAHGYHSVTIDAFPGLTVLDSTPGGFRFVPARRDQERVPAAV